MSAPPFQLKKVENIKEDLPFFMHLYPTLEIIEQNESNFEKILKLDLDEDKKEEENKNKENINEKLLTKEFLDELIKNPNNIPKADILEIVSNAIKTSKLIEKMEDDNKNNKKLNQVDLNVACAKKFTFIKVKKGEIIFRIGDDGDKFYYVLKGKANILKIKEIPNIFMSIIEYINYCIFLIKSEEYFLFQEVIRINNKVLKVSSEEEIITLFRIWFKQILIEKINQHLVNNNKTLEEFFESNEQELKEYNLDIRELEILEIDKMNKVPLSYIKWKNYIIKKCEFSTRELIFLEQYHKLLNDEQKKKITCLVYESLLFLGPKSYFGDSALDSETNKRNATIRAEEDTYLACLRSSDYINIIAPKRRYEKAKAIAFLFNTFFFQQINPHIFERNYFHLFYLKEYPKNTVLFDYGTIPKNLLLVKEGQISLDLKISVFEIHNLIKFLYSSIINNTYFKALSKNKKNAILSKEVLNELYKFTHEPKLDRLKGQNYRFIQEMNKIRNFRITILIGVEAVGLEEIFLNIPYLMKGIVIKKIVCYELAVDKIKLMLKEEKQIGENYAIKSIKKILSLIKRLQSIKGNCVEMASSKYNIKGGALLDKIFSSTQFPSIKNSKSNDNMLLFNQNNKNIDNYKKKLTTNEDIDYKEDINILLNKANSIQQNIFDKKEEENNKEIIKLKYNTQDNQMTLKKEEDNIDLQKSKKESIANSDIRKKDSYKKIQLINYNENSRNKIPLFKSPIRDFIIKKHPEYKINLNSRFKSIKLKKLNIVSYVSRSRKMKENIPSYNKPSFAELFDNSNEKIEINKSKPKLFTGVQMKNIFFLGENKYSTIKELKRQIQNINTIQKKGKKLEIIQSNEINNNFNYNYKGNKIHNLYDENVRNKLNIKKKLIKFSQNFYNYHLSFVPLSVKYTEELVNKNNNDNNNANGTYSKLTRNSSYTDKFFVNKTMKNYFLINKKNRSYMQRINSDLVESHKDLPKIKNTFFTFNKHNKINITDK